ncbi:NAD(P)H-dependent oxidoreductase [Candidatus Saccharibacteria bacterium]|nr:NAD(P)H-dependent oxidoreductase [Candidatus Saccharibacteria bacterium]
MRIAIVVGTTREGRVTPRLAHWVNNAAVARSDAEFVLLDLKDFSIPMLNDTPWLENRDLNEGTQKWLDELASVDGLILVTGEYNHTIPAVLKNAFDHTNGQVKRKPVAIVSHGVNSGVRANEHLRQMLNSNMDAFSISATVTFIGNIATVLNEQGEAVSDNSQNDSKLQKLLDDIVWYTGAIKRAKDDVKTD